MNSVNHIKVTLYERKYHYESCHESFTEKAKALMNMENSESSFICKRHEN